MYILSMKTKRLITFYSLDTLKTLESMADEQGYTTLTAFVNSFFTNLIEQKPMQVLNAHFSHEKQLGIQVYASSDKKAKNTNNKTKQTNLN